MISFLTCNTGMDRQLPQLIWVDLQPSLWTASSLLESTRQPEIGNKVMSKTDFIMITYRVDIGSRTSLYEISPLPLHQQRDQRSCNSRVTKKERTNFSCNNLVVFSVVRQTWIGKFVCFDACRVFYVEWNQKSFSLAHDVSSHVTTWKEVGWNMTPIITPFMIKSQTIYL